MIQVQNLSKTFKVHQKDPGLKGSIKALFNRQFIEKIALKNINFNINEGEMVGLVGANGAGKTTLLKILSGIVHHSEGKVSILGFNPWDRNNKLRRQMGLIMGQKAQLWWDLPAADCFLLLKEIYQISDADYKINLEELINALGVQDQMKIQIRRLSLGERMKMELIAALLHQPKVIFLDEPTIGLDIDAQRKIRQFLLDYHKRKKATMIITSHYMEDIEKLCQRLIIIRQGEFIYDGPLKKVIENFSQEKVLKITAGDQDIKSFQIQPHWGELISQDNTVIRIKISRLKIATVASEILNSIAVSDLAIEEVDIATIISGLMNGNISS